MTAPIRRSSLLIGAAMLAALAALAMSIGAPRAESATALKACVLLPREQDPPGSKPTYNLSLKQAHTPCSTAKKVMKAFHACRATKSYRCTHKILRTWKCTGRKSESTALIFYASYTCTSGSRKVTGTYQQNT